MIIGNKNDRKAFAAGFFSVFMYMGAFACGAPLWDKNWDKPMRRMLAYKKK